MDKKRKNIRLWIQILAAAVSNGYILGFLQGKIYQGTLKSMCVPGLNCYSCPGALGSCPIGALQAVIGSPGKSFSFYVIGFLMAAGALAGRLICGWLCPFGLFQDLLHKIPFFKKRKNLPGHRALIYLKYGILVIFVIWLPIFAVNLVGQGAPWFCKWICPAGTLEGGWTLLLLDESLRSAAGWLFTWKSFLLIVLILLAVFSYRPFCKYLCPLGAVYSLFNPIAFYRLRIREALCVDCGTCTRVCPMGISVCKTPNSGECIRCGKCKEACPEGAIVSTIDEWKRKEA